MNQTIEAKWPWIDGSNAMRLTLLDTLSDADLAFNPGGANVSLGALCVEMGEVEHAYIQSFQTFTQDWSYHAEDPALATSVSALRAWYQQLDGELQSTLAGLSDEDVKKTIDRGGGFSMPVDLQMDVYLQALLIFFGKVTVYFKAMNKPLPQQVREYIG